MKRLIFLILTACVLVGLGGCVYDPAYYHRSSVVYDDGPGTYSAAPAYYGSYYAPRYSYDPWYAWGWPYVGFGFYGSYYYGGGHHHYGHGSYGHGSGHHHH